MEAVKFEKDDDKELKKTAIFVAWPYANGPRHIGHASALMPADVVARYLRAIGNDVMMVSGTDEFGTPSQIAAEKAGIATQEYVDANNDIIRSDFHKLGMSFDWFTRTTSQTHEKIAQEFFKELVDNGHITIGVMTGSFDVVTGKSLPDRYVEGTCPKCNSEGARGDQCDSCTSILDSSDLINPVSTLTGNAVEFKEVEHYFLNLDKLRNKISDFLDGDVQLRKEARNFSESMVSELRPRAITRDLEWGIPLPSGYEIENNNRVLYVWFEAVIGYLSASIEWANESGQPDRWKEYWTDKMADNYYVMGKDNVPFHAIIWPAMLSAKNLGNSQANRLNLPKSILSTGNMNFGNDKFSSSRGNVVYISELIDAIGVDSLRYYLISAGPESSDSSFTFENLTIRINNELIAKWGNLISRTAALINNDFAGIIPNITELLLEDKNLLARVQDAYDSVGENIANGKLTAALKEAMDVIALANKYIFDQKPWDLEVKKSKRNAQVLAVLAVFIENLNKIMCPFIPHASQRINKIFGDEQLIAPMPELNDVHKKLITGNYSIGLIWVYTTSWQGNQVASGKHIIFEKLFVDELIKKIQDKH